MWVDETRDQVFRGSAFRTPEGRAAVGVRARRGPFLNACGRNPASFAGLENRPPTCALPPASHG